MSLFDKELRSRPYVIELVSAGGTVVEVKVEAYDVMEAIVTAMVRAETEHGEDPTRKVSNMRPDVDHLREQAMAESVVKRIVDGAGQVEPKKAKGEGA